MYNGKYNHIHLRHNIIKYLLSNEIISINYIKLKENIMNLLTNVLLKEMCII
jgi:hypothetical protein